MVCNNCKLVFDDANLFLFGISVIVMISSFVAPFSLTLRCLKTFSIDKVLNKRHIKMSTKFFSEITSFKFWYKFVVFGTYRNGEFFWYLLDNFSNRFIFFPSLVGMSEKFLSAFFDVFVLIFRFLFFLKWNLNSRFSVKCCHSSLLFMSPEKSAVRCIEYKPFGQSGSVSYHITCKSGDW